MALVALLRTGKDELVEERLQGVRLSRISRLVGDPGAARGGVDLMREFLWRGVSPWRSRDYESRLRQCPPSMRFD